MIDQSMLYDIIYALAASGGREKALFGSCAALAHEAFIRSEACPTFPELWFELPLLGDPWFDLHALVSREALGTEGELLYEDMASHKKILAWFARQGNDARQLALSYDVSSGNIDEPAVQLLLRNKSKKTACSFLEAAGRPDVVPAYESFVQRLPTDWFACYTGVFPARPGTHLRIECVPTLGLQRNYAADPGLLEKHLRQMGFSAFGDTLIPRCEELARTPFQFELQFDVNLDGTPGTTIGASLRFAPPPDTEKYDSFDPNGSAGALMDRVVAWGLADDRWSLLAGTSFSKCLSRGGKSALIYCFPAFVKLRWRNGEPLDAKAYLMAGAR